MRVVVDTNVLVSAALSAKSSPAVAVYLAEHRCILLKSTETEQELFQVVAREQLARLIAPPFLDWLSMLLDAAELVTITERVTECLDPKDDKFLELALNGRADIIISGDHHLLTLDPFRGIPIVKPAAFVQIVTG
ncbi:MAG: putative toxin-antitoxin system toxin component, PIN family [Syntrophobacteraceae bacterium]